MAKGRSTMRYLLKESIVEIKQLLREKSLAESTAEYIQVILELNQKVSELTQENEKLKEAQIKE